MPSISLIRLLSFLAIVHGASVPGAPHATEPRVAFLGNSITYDGRWVVLVESALRKQPPFAKADIVNLGLPSETVSGLSEEGHADGQFPRPALEERLSRVLDRFKPSLVVACYGMNDGIYQPLDPVRFKAFRDGITRLKTTVESRGARLILITPPLYRADQPLDDPAHYDLVLDAYAQWLVSRRPAGWEVVDIRPDLRKAIAAARKASPAFVFAGDGVHPGNEGHRFIAESVARQLWPLLKLQGAPEFAASGPIAILSRRADILKHAWLRRTEHRRPGIPAGMALDQAEKEASLLLDKYFAALPK